MKKMLCVLMLALALTGCTNSDMVRQEMRSDSEDNYGVMRTVTAYSMTGEKIGEWHGKIDVQYDYDGQYGANSRVDIVVFDGEEPLDRIIISNAIVIVDND